VQSPKFKFIRDELDAAFSASKLTEEWKKRVRYQIRKQLVFDPIEYRDYNDKLSSIVRAVRKQILGGIYEVRPAKRYLAEKSRGLCRQMTLVHPVDLLVLERLSRSVYFELKSKAPSKSAFFEPDDGKFIKGINQAEVKYGSFESWKRFQGAVFGFANENKYIVVTDVANFYDFINFQHLRNIVSSLADIRESLLDLLIYVLNKLTWTPDFMPLTQIGMPQIETSATRVLANAMLYEVDKVCEHSAVSNYARFMDDMDIGVETIADAKKIVRDVDLTLQSRQLRLNASKTRILTQKEAYTHFCIDENLHLARLERVIVAKKASVAGKILLKTYEAWMARDEGPSPGKSSPFHHGNGSKIHKYILGLLYQTETRVPDDDLLWLIRNKPDMRSTAFRYLSYSNNIGTAAFEVLSLLSEGIFVDDASLVDLTGFLLHSRIPKTRKTKIKLQQAIKRIEDSGDLGLHCAIFLSIKFSDLGELQSVIQRHKERIANDYWLARAAAGAIPRFIHSKDSFSGFHDLISELQNEEAQNVARYLLDISEMGSIPQSLKLYLSAPNSSYPQNIYFPKVIILLAACKNAEWKKLLPNVHKTHPALRADPFFKDMGF